MAYADWLAEYDRSYEDPPSTNIAECPDCGARELRLAFVQSTGDLEKGVPQFWCGSCLTGIFFCRVTIPENATVVSGAEIPNFRIISPD
ncbi:hypothetical protein [Acrocarpospora sp. B8E8]|uniref:hypothetical protein n=1 Tax=Acrocarpospora sp. B8E8 TaxID=3153572 RepID=UPI00325D131D